MKRRRGPMVLAFLAALAPIALAAGRLTVQVTQVRATGREPGPKDVDPALADLARALDSIPYHKLERVGTEQKSAAEGGTATFALRGGYSLAVTPGGTDGKKVVLSVAIKDKKGDEVFSTRLRVNDGATVLIGKDFDEGGGRLYIVLTVKSG